MDFLDGDAIEEILWRKLVALNPHPPDPGCFRGLKDGEIVGYLP